MKLLWLLDNVPAVKSACANGNCLFGTVDSWIIYRLSGKTAHVTDVSNASRTMLMDLCSLKWDSSVCRQLHIPMSMLPRICSSSEVYAHVAEGPLAGTPIAGCLGDQQSAMVGQLCFHTGNVKNTYGTGCFMLMNTGQNIVQSTSGLLTTVCFKMGRNEPAFYALEGSVAIAGAGIKWMRDNLGLVGSAEEVSTHAAEVPDTGGVYFVPAFSGLFAPYWRSDARGVICGLTLNTTKAHIARSAIEAVCFQSKEVIDAMNVDSQTIVSNLKVDGGMVVSDPLIQFQADILGIKVHRPRMPETTALGAAIAAGLAVGFFPSLEDVELSVGSKYDIFTPRMSPADRTKHLKGWKKAIERSLNWVEPSSDDSHRRAPGLLRLFRPLQRVILVAALGVVPMLFNFVSKFK